MKHHQVPAGLKKLLAGSLVVHGAAIILFIVAVAEDGHGRPENVVITKLVRLGKERPEHLLPRLPKEPPPPAPAPKKKKPEPKPEVKTPPKPAPKPAPAPAPVLAARPAPVKKAAPAPKRLPGPFWVYFDFDKSNLTPAARSVIQDAVAAIVMTDASGILLEAHADRAGGTEYNLKLSERRAKTVTDALVQAAIPLAKISVKSLGESKPRVPTADGQREEENRIVVIRLGR